MGTAASVAALVMPAAAAPPLHTRLLGHLDYAAPCSGVWGYSAPDGTELAIVGTARGTSFVDVTDPSAPREVGFVSGNDSAWREIRTWSHYAYIVTEGRPPLDDGPTGMQIVDLSRASGPFLAQHWNQTFTTAHTIAIHDGWAYINGSRKDEANTGMRILNLDDPAAPRDVGAYTTRYVHDSYVHQDTGYLCIIGQGLAIVDLSDRARPSEQSFAEYKGAGTHNAALARDGRTLFTTDETLGGHLRIWGVSNPRDPVQGGEWSAHETSSIHNVIVRGDSAYVSYYTEGVMVLDIANPRAPQLVAAYDTYPGTSGGYHGCWGVYVSPRTGYVYASDIQSGLFVIALEPQVAVTLQEFTAAARDDAIVLQWRLQRDAGDRGGLRLERAEADAVAATFTLCARFALGSGRFEDPQVVAGRAYRYRLAVETEAGDRVLGEVTSHAFEPGGSRLLGAAPNPAVSAAPATVRFDLARRGDVELRIWDARGRLVRALGARGLDSGRHALAWDGRDRSGRRLAPGIYFYELESAAWCARGRMTRVAR